MSRANFSVGRVVKKSFTVCDEAIRRGDVVDAERN